MIYWGMKTRPGCWLLQRTAVPLLLGLPFCVQAAQPSPKVVVISLDAFGAASLHEPHLPAPTLKALMAQGSYATSLRPINPTVTWPNHTAMVTGVNASRHHLLVNGLVVDQRTKQSPSIDSDASKASMVAVPTIYEVAHRAGLTTAQVDWVAIKDGGLDWQFAEHPDPDGAIERELVRQGVLTRDELAHFNEPSQAWRDRIYASAAVDIIRQHHPDLLLVHFLALDSIEHETGFGNDSGRDAIAFLDDRVKQVIDAVRAAGDLERTTFIIVSDHGQQNVHQRLHPNVLLKRAGLQTAAALQPAFCVPDGGFALVYQANATGASLQALKALFARKAGVRSALTPDEAAKDGWPIPAQSVQAPDLLLYASDGYDFTDGDASEFQTPTREIGAHGYPNTNPLMHGIFIAAGAGIRRQGEVATFSNLDVGPTIAQLLHISLGQTEGKPLTDILVPPAPATK